MMFEQRIWGSFMWKHYVQNKNKPQITVIIWITTKSFRDGQCDGSAGGGSDHQPRWHEFDSLDLRVTPLTFTHLSRHRTLPQHNENRSVILESTQVKSFIGYKLTSLKAANGMSLFTGWINSWTWQFRLEKETTSEERWRLLQPRGPRWSTKPLWWRSTFSLWQLSRMWIHVSPSFFAQLGWIANLSVCPWSPPSTL